MARVREGEDALAVRLVEERTGQPFAASIALRREAGMSFRAIGREFGIGHATIWRHWQDKNPATHAPA